MRKKLIVVTAFLLVTALIVIMYEPSVPTDANNMAILTGEGVEYRLTKAITPEEKANGLMNITELPKDEGMIFYFDPPREVTFWMKDTLISLDIIFLNENLEIINVHENASVNQTTERYSSNGITKYVIELNSGEFEKNGWKVGDKLTVINLY